MGSKPDRVIQAAVVCMSALGTWIVVFGIFLVETW